ncbi:peptidoglycan DD-metalloendopeptidase family protein [Microbacterium sp. CFH 31415]|uniref:peptidoglycan DD-metalloendopeptidase family protein n=1 Tax=Microbacterium sp. CFH 31415 TaxID=2921732 RepID=UPI001F141CEC|nr:peptidoglycan DD-metalloendopeptidase family protein [Microbacterium sp. CFH 31415]MCH6231001.1 peptidoglycan DD-metalloendopeptidase family protein [Microbacterium sp. CFH 31415]
MAEPARTRRSSRTSSTPVQATSETLGTSRAELRRRAAGAASERPAVVWGRPVEEKQKDAAPSAPTDSPVIAAAEVEDLARVQPLTDLPAAPVAPAPAPSAIEVPAAPIHIADPIAAAVPVAPAPQPVVAQPAPMSRRARRVPRTGEQPAVVVPPIALAAPAEVERPAPVFHADLPSAEAPAPMLEAVLAPAEPFQLLEPTVAPVTEEVTVLEVVPDETPVGEPTIAAERVTDPSEGPRAAASASDEFEAAARLFSFTGELPVQDEQVTTVDAAEPAAEPVQAAHTAPRKARVNRGASFKRLTAASFSVGVMGIVGLMTVGMTTPAEAVAAAGGAETSMSILAPGATTVTEVDADEIQAYVAPAGIAADTLDRTENYGTTTVAELASEAGIRNFSNLFVNDPNAAIQWPFAVGVTMSYGFGMRSGRMHEGIDFTPGAGAPIQAIADGTVRVASEAGGAYGVHVIIDHVIDGQLISSHYAHMEYGSIQVSQGQHVTVGTVLGRTGNTGRSYGAHTHFELLLNGKTAIDPLPWLREHTGG